MGSACTSESRSPSPVYGRNGVILKRPPSVTSYELRMERMNAEVAEARAKQRIAENMRNDFERDRDKLKRVIPHSIIPSHLGVNQSPNTE